MIGVIEFGGLTQWAGNKEREWNWLPEFSSGDERTVQVSRPRHEADRPIQP